MDYNSCVIENEACVIYLDHAATTTLSPHVREVMEPWLSVPANAGAKHHPYGAAAAGAVDKARAQVAGRIGAQPENIVFTSGATEANNLAIKGIAAHLKATGKTHIVTTAVEHKSVLAPLAALEGFTVSVLPVKPCGMIEAGMIEKALTAQTGLVCVQAVNNETGTIQPLSEIVAMLRGRGIFLHADAAQAVGKIDFNINESGADFAALSAHKVYGPQGIGALYVRGNVLTPLLHGGGQENGLRSGTLPVALCVGMGAAFKFAENRCAELQTQREVFLEKLAPLSP